MSKLTGFKKATKQQAKLRLAIFGPSGGGKTYTALRIATGLGGNIALIDTERGSASKYADRFDFAVLELPERDIETYCQAISMAQEAGFATLIIDSLSHAWQELLQEIDQLAKSRYQGNTWSAWSEGTPKQRRLVDAIVSFDGHVIATMRSKTEWVTEQDSRGKNKPVRVGLAPEQGKGIEYEFDLLMEISPEHIGNILKDRTGKYQDKIIEKPGEQLGQELAAWLAEGTAPKQAEPAKQQAQDDNDGNGGNGHEPEKEQEPEEPAPRPYDAETVKRGVLARAKKGDAAPLPASQYFLVTESLEALFPNDNADMRQAKRYSVLRYLFGVDSSKKLTVGQKDALLRWCTVDGDYTKPHPDAFAEAAAIVDAQGVANGQTKLPMEA